MSWKGEQPWASYSVYFQVFHVPQRCADWTTSWELYWNDFYLIARVQEPIIQGESQVFSISKSKVACSYFT